MKSETSLVAEQVRLQNWALQIQDCQNRPTGMSIDEWCEQNGIKKSLYYYRLRRLRKSCLDVAKNNAEPEFVELPVASLIEKTPVQQPELPLTPKVAAVLRNNSGLSLEIMDNAPASFLHLLIGAIQHVE